MNKENILDFHSEHKEKISIISNINIETCDMASFYTPGISIPCKEIEKDKENVWKYTGKGSTVAVVSDGTAVLGLGDIGALGAIPVMESKCVFFRECGGINAFPVCIAETDTEKLIGIIKSIAPVFGGINLEDIASPKCFEIEDRLQQELDIPVFHADQHGTSIVVAAALLNALKVAEKEISEVKITVNGPGAAGVAIIKLLLELGAKKITVCDEYGILSNEREAFLEEYKRKLIDRIPFKSHPGDLYDAMKASDVFIGVSVGNIVTEEMVKAMNKDAVVFALAGPVPEISYEAAKRAGAKIAATGSSENKNQINNSAVFPGIFKGALSVKAKEINIEMKKAAVFALRDRIPEEQLNEENIIPDPLDLSAADEIARRVSAAAVQSGAAR